MAGSSSQGDIFDVRKIRRLIELMNEHQLSEIDLQQGEMRIRIRSRSEPAPSAAAAPMSGSPAGAPSAGKPAPSPAVESGEAAAEHFAVIKSPMVGTFYAAPDPESPPFVRVGDHVGQDSVVCIIEAMKVFNQIPAEVSGKIVAVLAENGEPVEFGQPLFRVDTRG
jgi:acetyl-CoA carboxylase biotin carboxyl carrier protein